MRKLMTYLFLKLCLLQISYCSNECYEMPPMVYFLRTSLTNERLAPIRFVDLLRLKMNVHIVDIEDGPLEKVLDELNLPKDNDAVVLHPYVKDFYRYNFNSISERNFTLAGNVSTISEIPPQLVCRSVTLKKTNIDINKNNKKKTEQKDEIKNETKVLETCKEFNEIQHYVKLVSNNIYKYPELREIISNFSYDKVQSFHYEDWLKSKVFVCGAGYNNIKLDDHDVLSLKKTHECNYENTKGTIAVLARKPFKLTKKLTIPTIFYNDLYTTEPRDMFHNSLSLVKSSEKMKFAFLEAIKLTGLKRAAIITDDSPSSEAFERELASLFDTENIIYISKFCIPTHISSCDFELVFRSLAMADPLLIIVNVAEENARPFLNHASKLKKGMVWMVRSWSQNVAQKAAREIGNVYSVMLGPDPKYFEIPDCIKDYDTCNAHIILSVIHNILKYDIKSGLYEKYYCQPRAFLEKIKEVLSVDHDMNGYVTWHQHAYKTRNWIKISFSSRADSVHIEQETYPTFPRETKECTFKSDVYERPCNDIEVMLIMLVVAVFALTLLGIVYFFQIPDRSYSRMAC